MLKLRPSRSWGFENGELWLNHAIVPRCKRAVRMGGGSQIRPMLGPTIDPIDSEQVRPLVNDKSETLSGFPGSRSRLVRRESWGRDSSSLRFDPTSRTSRRPASPRPEVCPIPTLRLPLGRPPHCRDLHFADCSVRIELTFGTTRREAPHNQSFPSLNLAWKSLERVTDLKICARLNHPHHHAIILTAASGFPLRPWKFCSPAPRFLGQAPSN